MDVFRITTSNTLCESTTPKETYKCLLWHLQQLQLLRLKENCQESKLQAKMHSIWYAWRTILLSASLWSQGKRFCCMILESGFMRNWLRHVFTSCCDGSSTMDFAYLAIDKKRDCLLTSFFSNRFQLLYLSFTLIFMLGVTSLDPWTPFFKLDSK